VTIDRAKTEPGDEFQPAAVSHPAEESVASAGGSLQKLEAEIHSLASSALARTDTPEQIFERAAVLRDNAMGIIYDGDGSSDTERVGRLLALIPALLTVVDEARDTIGRLRDLAGEPDAPKAISPYDTPGRRAPAKPTWGTEQQHG
jgi:hypothetical protein